VRLTNRVFETMNNYNIPSPCISVCDIDEASELCVGCWRTIEEITCWSTLSEAQRDDVFELLGARRKAFADGQQIPTTPSKPSKSDSSATGLPGNRSEG